MKTTKFYLRNVFGGVAVSVVVFFTLYVVDFWPQIGNLSTFSKTLDLTGTLILVYLLVYVLSVPFFFLNFKAKDFKKEFESQGVSFVLYSFLFFSVGMIPLYVFLLSAIAGILSNAQFPV
jgi:hypothetical protein